MTPGLYSTRSEQCCEHSIGVPQVQLPTGEVIDINDETGGGGRSSYGSEEIIDVEVRDVR